MVEALIAKPQKLQTWVGQQEVRGSDGVVKSCVEDSRNPKAWFNLWVEKGQTVMDWGLGLKVRFLHESKKRSAGFGICAFMMEDASKAYAVM